MTVAASVCELRLLFLGEHLPDDQPDYGDGWATRPCHSMQLVCEIARRTDPQTEGQLRQAIFATLAIDDIPPDALEAVRDGFNHYRNVIRGGRGL